MKNAIQLERHFKGAANHTRLQILLLLASHDQLTLEGIVQYLGSNVKTTSEHTRRLVQAGLVNKKYKGRTVLHSLSPYGKRFSTFLKTF